MNECSNLLLYLPRYKSTWKWIRQWVLNCRLIFTNEWRKISSCDSFLRIFSPHRLITLPIPMYWFAFKMWTLYAKPFSSLVYDATEKVGRQFYFGGQSKKYLRSRGHEFESKCPILGWRVENITVICFKSSSASENTKNRGLIGLGCLTQKLALVFVIVIVVTSSPMLKLSHSSGTIF